MNLVLANSGYATHMTDEGFQLQEGLHYAGWHLCGPGYDNLRHVRTILNKYKPSNIFVQDKRDWDPDSGCPGAHRYLKFKEINALADSRYAPNVSLVVKDAGPEGSEYHHAFCDEVRPDAVVIYYHPLSVLRYCPWLASYKLIRIHHTIDPYAIPPFAPASERENLCGSGAVMEEVYPLRMRVSAHPQDFGMSWLRHPGYHNDRGPATPLYLRFLNRHKVSFATASAYGFSLRKIIEGVACGCTVVTDLPQFDVLPEIDRALVRIKPTISDADLKLVFQEAIEMWDADGRRKWAEKAIAYYDYRVAGVRLSDALQKV